MKTPRGSSIDWNQGLAVDLAAHVNTKHPKAKVFGIVALPELADTPQRDVARARASWLSSLQNKAG